jgi:hypothetical protein
MQRAFIDELNRPGSALGQLHFHVQFFPQPMPMPVPQVK